MLLRGALFVAFLGAGFLGAASLASGCRTTGGETIPVEESSRVAIDLHRERYPFVAAVVNEVPTSALVDSGAGMTLIDRRLVARLGLRGRGALQLRGVGGTEPASLVHIDVSLGSVVLVRVLAASLDLSTISRSLGRQLDLVLGPELYEHSVVDLDYPKRELRLHDPATFEYLGSGRTERLFRGSDGALLVGVSLEGSPKVQFEIDTANGHALDCFRSTGDRLGLLRGRARTSIHYSRGVGGTMRSTVATLERVEFGGFPLESVPTHFPAAAGSGSFAAAGGAGSLGAAILTRFRVIIDGVGARVHLEPGPDLGDPFRRDLLGLVTAVREGHLEVVFVAPGSPAASSGFRLGVRILAVDGNRDDPSAMRDRLEELRVGPAGRWVRLTDGGGRTRDLKLEVYY